ncbi:MAG: hypothetical protein LBH39_00255 [Clostridiales Family XIII bacterium]|jgi:hypothetical protein|nr:hypothetical protein [Clostridiales Family XIII bacterium]
MACGAGAGSKGLPLCGVKFCGGCNPRYARGDAFRAIKPVFEGRISFVFAEDGGSYDLLLYFAGCTSRCTDLSRIRTAGGLVAVHEWDGIAGAIARLEEFLARG